jgi:hypothetical protein
MLSIARIDTETHERYVLARVLLVNHGTAAIKPGTLFARQTSRDGTVRVLEFHNAMDIPSGRTTRVSQLLTNIKQVEFTGYHQSDGVIVPFSGGVLKRRPFFRSFEVVTRRLGKILFAFAGNVRP